MSKYAQGKYKIANPNKYLGNKQPTYRSSWELSFMRFCDNNPNIIGWASEAVHIPYRNPFTNKNTIYVPDFLIVYVDRTGQKHAELIEVKPRKEIAMENAKSYRDQLMVALNYCKWEAAKSWAKMNNMTFRVVTENDLYHNGKAR